MSTLKTLAAGAGLALALCAALPSTASAHGFHHFHGGFGFHHFHGGFGFHHSHFAGWGYHPHYYGYGYRAYVGYRACPIGYHLGPFGRYCWPND